MFTQIITRDAFDLAVRRAFSAGEERGRELERETVLHGLKTVAGLNGSGERVVGMVRKAENPERSAWISAKIKKLRDEGKPEKQAAAIAYSMWRRRKLKAFIFKTIHDAAGHDHDEGTGRFTGGSESSHELHPDTPGRVRHGIDLLRETVHPSAHAALTDAVNKVQAAGFPLRGFDVRTDLKTFQERHGAKWSSVPASIEHEGGQRTLLINPAYFRLHNHAERAKQNHESGYASSGDPSHVFVHELAHTLHSGAADAHEWESGEREVAAKASRRAAHDPAEFVAEVFAGIVAGNKYPDDVMTLYRKLDGPESAVRKSMTWVEGQHPRSKDGTFIKKNEVDDAKAAYKRGDKGPMEALRAKVHPDDLALLNEHLSHQDHAGDARAFHPAAQEAGHLRQLGWVKGAELTEHVGKYLDQIASSGPLSPESTRDLMLHVGNRLRSARVGVLHNMARSVGIKRPDLMKKDDIQAAIKNAVKAAVFDAEVAYHGQVQPEGDEFSARAPVTAHKALDAAGHEHRGKGPGGGQFTGSGGGSGGEAKPKKPLSRDAQLRKMADEGFAAMSGDDQKREIDRLSRTVQNTVMYKPGSTAQKQLLSKIKKYKKLAGDNSPLPETVGKEIHGKIDSLKATLAMGGLEPGVESAHRAELARLEHVVNPLRKIDATELKQSTAKMKELSNGLAAVAEAAKKGESVEAVIADNPMLRTIVHAVRIAEVEEGMPKGEWLDGPKALPEHKPAAPPAG